MFFIKMACAVTGTTGFIGSEIAKIFRQEKIRVVEMTRTRRPGLDDRDYLFFDLASPSPVPDLYHIEVLIHVAHDLTTKNKQLNHKINFEGSAKLLRHAKRCGVKKIIFISSMSAFQNARSQYGRTKLAIEAVVAEIGGIVVRPGLVFDENPRGLVGAMHQFIRYFPIVPLIGLGKQPLYLCHVQDLVKLLLYLTECDDRHPEKITAASKKMMTFREIVLWLAARQHKKIKTVPVPYSILLLGMKLLEQLGMNKKLRSDSLVGAKYVDPYPDFSGTDALPIQFRSCDECRL